MKNKIEEIIKEYTTDIKKYFKYVKGKIKHYINVSKGYYHNIKNNFKEREKRKKYLTISITSAFVLILILNIFASSAYYRDTDSISLIHALVGDISKNNYDYVLKIFLENAGDDNEYHLVSDIPTFGYSFSGYKCQNNSILNFSNDLKNFSSTLTEKDICSAYFDLISESDININIMLEDDIKSGNYVLGEVIPAYGYTYSHYECDNNNELEYNSELHKVVLKTNKKDNCSIYFTKDTSDITARLFIEEDVNSNKYIERFSIPANVNYSINSERSNCKNSNNERIETDITYKDGYINANVSEIATCEFYLDKNE